MTLLAQQGGFDLPTMVFILAMLFTIWLMFARSRRRFSRRDEPPIVRIERPAPQPPSRPADAPDALDRWEVHMHETARELSAQLDSKMSALLHLVREADRAAARLEKALEAGRAADAQAESQPEAAGPAAANDAVAREPDGPAAATDDPAVGRLRDEIHLLSDYGFEPSEIAHRMGLPPGEVQRVLALRGKR